MLKIQILGTGCPKCKKLTENAEKAMRELNTDYEIIKVADVDQIMRFGVMITPALAVNDEVKSAGRVLNVEEIKKIIS